MAKKPLGYAELLAGRAMPRPPGHRAHLLAAFVDESGAPRKSGGPYGPSERHLKPAHDKLRRDGLIVQDMDLGEIGRIFRLRDGDAPVTAARAAREEIRRYQDDLASWHSAFLAARSRPKTPTPQKEIIMTAATPSTTRSFPNEGAPLDTLIVRMVPQGGAYGRVMGLVNESPDPLIEFWDPNHAHATLEDGHTGQFISRFRLSEIAHITSGIDLDGGVDNWKLSAAGYDAAMAAVAPEVRRHVAFAAFSSMEDAEMTDILSDLLREEADLRDIPDGEGRDAFLQDRLAGYDFTPETGAEVFARMDIKATDVPRLFRDALSRAETSPEPGA